MQKSEFTFFMNSGQKTIVLRQIKSGHIDHLADWILEGFQDLGLIDHKNNLTPDGEAFLARTAQTIGYRT